MGQASPPALRRRVSLSFATPGGLFFSLQTIRVGKPSKYHRQGCLGGPVEIRWTGNASGSHGEPVEGFVQIVVFRYQVGQGEICVHGPPVVFQRTKEEGDGKCAEPFSIHELNSERDSGGLPDYS